MQRLLEATARAEETHFWFRGLRRTAEQLLLAASGGRRGSRVVDCGTGTGRNLEWLERFGQAVGVETAPFGLAAGRQRGRRVVAATVTALPFADASADFATSFDVLYCLDEPAERRALREMWRVLKPGGIAMLNVAAFEMLRGSHSTLSHEVRRYTPATLRASLVATGFVVERLTFTNLTLFPFILAVRVAQRVTGTAARPSDSDLNLPPGPINEFFNLALTAEAAILRVANLPIGTSLMAVARKPL
jgi:SAM-dependent methyltransferase